MVIFLFHYLNNIIFQFVEPPTTTTGGETTTSKPTAGKYGQIIICYLTNLFLANCLQSRINQFCSANSQYSFARFGEDDLWGCYEKLDKDGEMEYQCVNKDGDDLINCVRYADDSLYTQLDDAIIEEASKGCDGNRLVLIFQEIR